MREGKKLVVKDGFRLNVGIIIVNTRGQLLWARRAGFKNAWQFPQGGIHGNETTYKAMYRELREELGLMPQDVTVLAESKKWLSYLLPEQFRRYENKPLVIGQKQKWFLLQLITRDTHIHLNYSENPEFDRWRWVDYWYPLDHVIEFKKKVYEKVLQEFESVVLDLKK